MSKNYLNFILKTEFFGNLEENPVAKHLTILYTTSAAMYYEDFIRRGFKLSAITLFIFSVVFILTNVYFLSVTETSTLDLKVISFTLALLAFTIQAVLMPVIFYVERKRIRTALNAVAELDRHRGRIAHKFPERNYEEIDFVKYLVYVYLFQILTYLVAMWSRFVICLLTIESLDEIDSSYDYPTPSAFGKSPTMFEYIGIYSIQVLFLGMLVMNYWSCTMFMILILLHLKNHIIALRSEMKMRSDCTLEVIEKCRGMKGKAKFRKVKFSEEGDCYRDFANHMREWITRHQEITLVMKNLQRFIQTTMTTNLSMALIVVFMFTTVLSVTTTARNEETLAGYLNIIGMIPTIFANCFIAYLFQDMMSDLTEEIYATPWYCLPAQQRRIVVNFLVITQKTNRVKAFNIFPLSLATLLQIMMKLYSYSQVLNALKH